MNILKRLFDPNYGLTEKQRIALGNLHLAKNKQVNQQNAALALQQGKGSPVDWMGVEMYRQELQEQCSYMEWYIRNHPEEIRDNGTFKTVYYKNNQIVRMA